MLIFDLAGINVTLVSAGVGDTVCTVMLEVPVTLVEPDVAVAVIVANPAATPVTKPVLDTVATALSLEV